MGVDFTKLRFGKEAAEEEKAHLLEYFVETKAFKEICAGEGWIVLGTKGSGKTALATKLLASSDADVGYVNVSPSTVDWELLRSAQGGITRQTRKAAWMLSFLTAALAQAKVGVNRPVPEEAILAELEKVGLHPDSLRKSWKLSDIGIEKGLPMFRAQRDSINPDLVIATSRTVENAIHVALGILEESLRADGYTLRLIVDRFDEHWKGDADDVDTAISLILASQEVHDRAPSIRPLVFVRTDIWSKLGWATVDHLNSQIVRLSWSSSDLAELIRRRIEWSLNTRTDSAEHALGLVFYGYVSVRLTAGTSATKGTILPWQFISTVTPRRPRDVVLFAEMARKARSTSARWISGEDLLKAEPDYSTLRRRNVEKAEGAHLSGLLKRLNDILRDMPPRMPAKTMHALLERHFSGNAREMLNVLMEYEICGLVKSGGAQGQPVFLEDDGELLETGVRDEMYVVIHPSLRHALGVPDDIRFSDFQLLKPATWEEKRPLGERRPK